MFSTTLELAGFGLLVAAAALLGGLVAAFLTAAPILLLLGYSLDDERATLALRRAVLPVRLRLAAVRGRRKLKLAKAA